MDGFPQDSVPRRRRRKRLWIPIASTLAVGIFLVVLMITPLSQRSRSVVVPSNGPDSGTTPISFPFPTRVVVHFSWQTAPAVPYSIEYTVRGPGVDLADTVGPFTPVGYSFWTWGGTYSMGAENVSFICHAGPLCEYFMVPPVTVWVNVTSGVI